MVAGAVGMIIVGAALAAFDLQAQFSRNTERLLGTQSSAGLAMTMMQRDLENAGLRFRGGVQSDGGTQFAAVVRPYDNLGTNITQIINDVSGGKVVAASPPNPGFIPGTDAFEVLLGSAQIEPTRLGAQVTTVGVWGGPTMTVNVSPNPFVANELIAANGGNNGPLLMFWNDDVHCIARMVAPSSLPSITLATITVAQVDQDLVLNGAPWVSSSTNCPAYPMRVEVLRTRRRYLVYQTDSSIAGQPARIGLAIQRNAWCDPVDGGPACSSDLQAPQLIAEGIDNMQIAWRVPNGWAPDAGAWCQRSANEPCSFDQPTIQASKLAASIVGAQINLSSRGPEVLIRPNEPVPQLLNSAPATPDGIVRSIMQTGVTFRNVVNP
jgi:hypothetical protein